MTRLEALLVDYGGVLTGDRAMIDVVRKVRAAGFKTALLSNSAGVPNDGTGWDSVFDAVVVSGEVGMRKPDPEIYRHCARTLGVSTSACVFVDDLASNVSGAVAAGMVGIRHVGVDSTVAELEALLGVPA